MKTNEREVVRGLLRTVEAAIAAGDWKVDGACDPDLDMRRVRVLMDKGPGLVRGECGCGLFESCAECRKLA